MKNLKISSILVMALMLMSCNCKNNANNSEKSSCATTTCEKSAEKSTASACGKSEEKKSCCSSKSEAAAPVDASVEAVVVAMADFDAKAESLLNKNVKITGWVSHICSHSGKKCFLTDKDETVKVRVEAKGNINGFDKELAGSEIIVSGVVRVSKITAEFLSQWEAKVKAKAKDIEEGGKHCSSELGNIAKMKEWMSTNKKDFYPVYFIDGMSYEEIN